MMRVVNSLAGLLLIGSLPGHAFQFDTEGPWEASLDSTITYAAMWRLNGQNKDLLKDWQRDDSNRNFDEGLVSNSLRIISDLEVRYRTTKGDSYGLFTRGTAYYDDEIVNARSDNKSAQSVTVVKDLCTPRGLPACPTPMTSFYDSANSSTTYGGSVEGNRFHQHTEDAVGQGFEMLDFFVFADIGAQSDHPATIRVGKQVINWGESAFIQNGISAAMNYADVNKAALPGVEVKEILRPLGAVYGTYSLTDNVNLQAYYQYEWHENIIPAYGSYLNAVPDFLNGDGGENLLIPMELLAQFLYFSGPGGPQQLHDMMSLQYIPIDRVKDDAASDSGQWGVAVNWYAPELLDTEFGFYALNYHRKLPDLVVDNYRGDVLDQGYTPAPGPFGGQYAQDCTTRWGAQSGDCAFLGAFADFIDVASYQSKYYEDVKLYGFSWNTVIPITATAWSGEIAYHHNIPVQTLHAFQGLLSDSIVACNPLLAPGDCGHELSSREDVVVMQMMIFHDFNNITIADDVGLIMEIGWIHAVDLDDGNVIKPFQVPDSVYFDSNNFADHGTAIGIAQKPQGILNENGQSAGGVPFVSSADGISSQRTSFDQNGVPFSDARNPDRGSVFIGTSPASKDSFGYQMVWNFTWFDAMGQLSKTLSGIDLRGQFIFRHDFDGTSVIPGTGFTEGHKAVTVGLEGLWQNTWSAKLQYTNFFGSSRDSLGWEIGDHPLDDRDFISLNIKYRI